uniref:Uncharacterized protein n=1 Tax=Leptobrachium leishanense TaxID=445787 RepID=A0A8C5QKS7_9ANUR
MDPHVPLCTLRLGGQRYLCHGHRVTDGVDVWRSDLTKEAQEEWAELRILSPAPYIQCRFLCSTSHSLSVIHQSDVDTRRRGYGISATNVTKRLPGESLVNPGCKSKKAATGVDFDEA